MNIKTCKICDRELPESAFMRTKGGGLTGICRECRTAALRENKAAKRSQGGVNASLFRPRLRRTYNRRCLASDVPCGEVA